jgi:pantoate--beta-alanine ligase
VRASQGGAVADVERGAEAALKAAGFDSIDYVAIRRAEDLSAFAGPLDGPARILAAAKIGRTRLIDNMAV